MSTDARSTQTLRPPRLALDVFKQAARPFSIYAATAAVCAGVFVPFVTVEKLMVAASLTGVVAGLRSLDKKSAGG